MLARCFLRGLPTTSSSGNALQNVFPTDDFLPGPVSDAGVIASATAPVIVLVVL